MLLSSCLWLGFKPQSPDPAIRVDPAEHDFGDISSDKPVSCEFTVANAGGKSLEISRVQTTCGCTAAVIGHQLLKPGESTKLKVTFDPRGRMGQQGRAIIILSNDPRTTQKTVGISANVTTPTFLTPDPVP
jgi:hypothetical protein